MYELKTDVDLREIIFTALGFTSGPQVSNEDFYHEGSLRMKENSLYRVGHW